MLFSKVFLIIQSIHLLIFKNKFLVFDDAFFFNRTGLERLGVVWPEPRLLLDWSTGYGCGIAGLQALDVVFLCKDKKEEGSSGLHLWPLRCLSQFLAERKDRMLRGRMFLRTFH